MFRFLILVSVASLALSAPADKQDRKYLNTQRNLVELTGREKNLVKLTH